MTCPYCKTAAPRPTRKVVCQNCQDYASAMALEKAQRQEVEMFRTYWAVPHNWQDDDAWRSNPYFLRANS